METFRKKKAPQVGNEDMNPGGGYWYGYGYQQPQVTFLLSEVLQDVCHVQCACTSVECYVTKERRPKIVFQVPLRKGWTKKVPGPSHFGAYHAFYSPTTGLSGGGKWGAEVKISYVSHVHGTGGQLASFSTFFLAGNQS